MPPSSLATPLSAASGAPFTSPIDLIGHTPILQLKGFNTGPCELYLKLESQNPGGSIKDRMALRMVEEAEKEGLIKPGDTLVEATAGNTGLALAQVAAVKGYKLIVVVPDKMSAEKVNHLRAMGVHVILTRNDVQKGHPDYYHEKARAVAEATPNAFYINQFENGANPDAHEATTAPEIWEQMNHRVDAIVCGVGTGGTMAGLARYFKKVSPNTEMVLADPEGSVLAPFVKHGNLVAAGSWLVEGIGEDFIPPHFNASDIAKAYSISDEESIRMARGVLTKTGILCGSSSGTLIAAALQYCREQKTPKRVVTFVCDSGSKYLSKMYNPYWLQDNGLAQGPLVHDLRDLIARPFLRGEVISVHPSDTLNIVYSKMKMNDISQIPVIEKGEIIGIVDETDLLMAITGNPQGFSIRVGAAMTDKMQKLDVKSAITDLLPIFEHGRVACIFDGTQFLGIITPIDLLNHMRKRTGRE